MIIGNTQQRYLNLMTEMSKTSKFTPAKLLKQFRASLAILDVLKQLNMIKKVDSDGRMHCYTWIGTTPDLKLAGEVRYFVTEGIKDAVARVVKKKTAKQALVQTTQMITSPNPVVLTDEMCIEHLKNSKEFKYEIYRVVREQL